MRRTLAKASAQSAVNLLFFAVIGTVVLSSTYYLTRDRINQSIEAEKLRLIAQVVPATLFDNTIVQDTTRVQADELLGTTEPTRVYRARLHGEPTAVVLQPIAPDGYSGRIDLLVAIRTTGELSGVRVVAHKETPGLGDYIEVGKSDWIKGFDDQSLAARDDAGWKVKKDGGQFDYMTGATISPRAVVKAVHKTLQYFAQHRDELLSAPSPQGETDGQ